jgi:hypothetical protein
MEIVWTMAAVLAVIIVCVVGVALTCRPRCCPKCGKRTMHIYADMDETLRTCYHPGCGFYERSPW